MNLGQISHEFQVFFCEASERPFFPASLASRKMFMVPLIVAAVDVARHSLPCLIREGTGVLSGGMGRLLFAGRLDHYFPHWLVRR